MTPENLAARVATLRAEFDTAFAAASQDGPGARQDFLAVRAGGEAYVLPLRELAGFYADKQWRRLPGSASALLGIAGFRGVLAPVYDLALLLGHAAAASPRWVVLGRGEVAYGLAFDTLEGHVRARHEDIVIDETRRAQAPVSAYLRADDATRGVLDLPALLKIIEERAQRAERL